MFVPTNYFLQPNNNASQVWTIVVQKRDIISEILDFLILSLIECTEKVENCVGWWLVMSGGPSSNLV